VTEPEIWASAGGPFLVRGGLPLRWRRPVHTSHGEPVAWVDGEPIETGRPGRPYALCRCGQSSNKPFCDGSHNEARGGQFAGSAGGDLTDAPPAGSYADRAEQHHGDGLIMRDDRSLCMRAGFCANRTTSVWKLVPDSADPQVRAQLLAMVERCPSGALTYSLDGVGDVESQLPAEVAVEPDGPLMVTGCVRIRRADGTEMEVRNRVTLCRCGASKNKPLCDGSHVEVNFRDP
jgi:CDGSH-type Zn-finger protein/uncharacterized Fe-S cluster protein YjdI